VQKIPAIIAVGKREVEEGTVAVRRLGSKHQKTMSLDEAIAGFVEESTMRGAQKTSEAA
jgi:threonyl-tRNA synthetase